MTAEGLTASEMTAAFAARTLSPVEVTQAALARVDRLNPRINAFFLVDYEGALNAARQSEARWHAGTALGPLDGVPTSVKDALQTIGHVGRRGSAATDTGSPPADNDAPAVARLKEGGSVILGRTTMCDFGILPSGYSSAHGPTRNPWDTLTTSGGSSAGAAAAVAAVLHPVAVGTDIVGSIRLPASFCGLVGYKPSQGRVPYFPQNSPSLVAGPLARTVEDAALLMSVIAQPDARDFTALPYDPVDYVSILETRPQARRIGFLREIGFGPKPDPEVQTLVAAKARALAADLGAEIIELSAPFNSNDEATAEDFYRIRCLTEFQRLPPSHQERARVILDWTAPARGWNACDTYDRYAALQGIRNRAIRLLDGFDFLILPSVAVPAFAADLPGPDPDRMFEGWSNTFIFNLSEQPAVSVPAGLTRDGLPVGLQVVGRRFDDVGVLRMARAAEQLWGPFAAAPIE